MCAPLESGPARGRGCSAIASLSCAHMGEVNIGNSTLVGADAGGLKAGELAVDVRDVEKTYRGGVRALRGVSMQIHAGEIFGLLGPNGAGKSTLVKILMTVIRASKCGGTVLGQSVGHKGTLRRVGYLPEHHRFPEYLTGRQVLEHFAAMSDVPRRERKQRADKLLDLVGMTKWQKTKVQQYSKGMRQRIGVAQALMMDPDLVVLDEPTDGVDPVGRREIRNILLEQKRLGKAVLVNSHLLSELEVVSDRVAIMVQGRVPEQGTLDELTAYGQRYEIEVATPGDGATAWGLERVLSEALGDKWSRMGEGKGEIHLGERTAAVEVAGSMIKVMSRDAEMAQPVLDAMRGRGLVVKSLRDVRPTLEDLFIKAVMDPTTGRAMEIGAGGKGDKNKNGDKNGTGGEPGAQGDAVGGTA